MARDYGKYVGALLLFGSNGIVASGIALPSSSVVLLRTLLGSLLLAALLVAAKRRITFHRHLGDLCCLAASGAALGYASVFASASNTLIAPILIGAEVFGLQALPFFVVSVAFSRLFNHGRSIYPQRGNSGVSGGENGNIRPSSEKD